MPIIEPEDKVLKSLVGVHLWHAGLSSCSQRVRIVLAEKSQEFESHLINLAAGENASPEYQRIHPNGLVPALVINGELIIESLDIINEIDARFPDNPLCSLQDSEQREMREIMKLANEAQSYLKLLTFEFLFSAAPPPPSEVMENFQKLHRNEGLKRFHRDAKKGFDRDRIENAVNACHEDFLQLDHFLSDGRKFLAGDQFSLADIAWMPNLHRFTLIQWPFDQYLFLPAWFERVSSRTSYKKALLDWQPKELIDIISPKIKARSVAGDGVETYGALSEGTEKGETFG